MKISIRLTPEERKEKREIAQAAVTALHALICYGHNAPAMREALMRCQAIDESYQGCANWETWVDMLTDEKNENKPVTDNN